MLALGLASVPFVRYLQTVLVHYSIRLPETPSGALLYVVPKRSWEMDAGGGGASGRERADTIISNVEIIGFKGAGKYLSGATIIDADLNEADLRDADLSRAEIRYSRFIESDLSGIDFTDAEVFETHFTNSNLNRTKLVQADLRNSDFTGASFYRADLTNANLSNTDLEKAIGLTYDQLRRAVIDEWTFPASGLGAPPLRIAGAVSQTALTNRAL